jgi:hypothetical protein
MSGRLDRSDFCFHASARLLAVGHRANTRPPRTCARSPKRKHARRSRKRECDGASDESHALPTGRNCASSATRSTTPQGEEGVRGDRRCAPLHRAYTGHGARAAALLRRPVARLGARSVWQPGQRVSLRVVTIRQSGPALSLGRPKRPKRRSALAGIERARHQPWRRRDPRRPLGAAENRCWKPAMRRRAQPRPSTHQATRPRLLPCPLPLVSAIRPESFRRNYQSWRPCRVGRRLPIRRSAPQLAIEFAPGPGRERPAITKPGVLVIPACRCRRSAFGSTRFRDERPIRGSNEQGCRSRTQLAPRTVTVAASPAVCPPIARP